MTFRDENIREQAFYSILTSVIPLSSSMYSAQGKSESQKDTDNGPAKGSGPCNEALLQMCWSNRRAKGR